MSDEEFLEKWQARQKKKDKEAEQRIKAAITLQKELSDKISDEGLKISASDSSRYWR